MKPRIGEKKKDLQQTQLYFYEKLSFIIRYLYITGGNRNKAKFQKMMDKIRVKYVKMVKKSERTERKITKWIREEEKLNLPLKTMRTSKNSKVTLSKKKEENGENFHKPVKRGVQRKMLT